MSRPKKERYPISKEEPPGGGLFAAFAGLSAEGLPPGEEVKQEESVGNRPGGAVPRLGRAILRKETAHRGGKTVLVIRFDLEHDDAFLEQLAKKLRVACGCGGALKEREIELQGKKLETVREMLAREGFQVAGITRVD